MYLVCSSIRNNFCSYFHSDGSHLGFSIDTNKCFVDNHLRYILYMYIFKLNIVLNGSVGRSRVIHVTIYKLTRAMQSVAYPLT